MAANDLGTLQRELVPAAGPASISHGTIVLVLAPGELATTARRLRDEFGFDLVPLLFAVNDPSGTITGEAFDRIAGEMMRLLEDGGK